MINIKAPNGYGSVYKLKGNRRNPWTARITTGKKLSKDGTRFFQSYAYLGYYRTRKEAQDALADYNLSKHTTAVKSGRKTLLDVYTEWSEKEYPNLSDRTVHVYRNGWNVLRPLYDIEVDSITLQMIEKDAKTASGVRLVPIHEKTLPFWKTFLESNLWRSVGILGTGADASRATSVRTIFKNYLHDYSPHDARHSCVSMLQEIPCPKPIIQSIVGHKGKDVTDTFYTHINLETKLEWINKI